MAWHLHIANRAIYRLDILGDSRQPLLAVWTQPGRVSYVDLQSGATVGEQRLTDLANRQPEHWQTLLSELQAPNGVYPPVVVGAGLSIYLTQTGQQRLYHLSSGEIFLAAGAREAKLDGDARFRVVALNRTNGVIGALDSSGKLHVYQQGSGLKIHDIGLPALDPEVLVAIVIPGDNSTIYIACDRLLLRVNAQGQVDKRAQLHYPIGAFACSARGERLVCSDRDTNVIRVYNAADLQPLYQRHAADLIARATQVQLIADPAPSMVALNHLAVDDEGQVAFALAGVVCATDVTEFLALPRPVG
jgi:hypothetical protein